MNIRFSCKDSLGKYTCAKRDRIVFETTHKHNKPITTAMRGGYTPNLRHYLCLLQYIQNY
ncbi:MAG: hypothetical protein MI739_12090 [Bacteroidales bacterium]|nr:hypothetical protein [Bacteroidales bacterium]